MIFENQYMEGSLITQGLSCQSKEERSAFICPIVLVMALCLRKVNEQGCCLDSAAPCNPRVKLQERSPNRALASVPIAGRISFYIDRVVTPVHNSLMFQSMDSGRGAEREKGGRMKLGVLCLPQITLFVQTNWRAPAKNEGLSRCGSRSIRISLPVGVVPGRSAATCLAITGIPMISLSPSWRRLPPRGQ